MDRFLARKDPDSTVDYQFDWSDWLGADTIQTSAWDVGGDLTYVGDSNDPTSTTVWVSGGTAGSVQTLRNRITTAGGRISDRTIILTIANR